MVNKLALEREDVISKAARIAKNCGSPRLINNKRKLLSALVLHIAACIISEQKREIQRARELHQHKQECSPSSGVQASSRLGNVMRKVANLTKINRAVASRRRTRCYSDQGGNQGGKQGCHGNHSGNIYDLSQYTYPGSCTLHRSTRLVSRPLRPISPEPQTFNCNVQRRPWSTKAGAGDEQLQDGGGAKYRFPAIKKYGRRNQSQQNLIDIEN